MQGQQLKTFQDTVLEFYRGHGRHDLPWRQPAPNGVFDPYKILVSEIMLQQTQVPRVLPKFLEFTQLFPTFKTLAAAPLADVLKVWSGLGYNRRAKFLWQAAQIVAHEYNGVLPRTSAELIKLPGIGPNTAGALLAYAFNIPAVYIETNVRTVFIRHFFADREGVDDRDILEMVARTLPSDARTWYWALMDYGTHLKQTVGNLNKLSRHYTVQSKFAGSKRQLRGEVLRQLAIGPKTAKELLQALADDRAQLVLDDLTNEGMVTRTESSNPRYKLPGS
jgi:A/G-specific adenine glycosylase